MSKRIGAAQMASGGPRLVHRPRGQGPRPLRRPRPEDHTLAMLLLRLGRGRWADRPAPGQTDRPVPNGNRAQTIWWNHERRCDRPQSWHALATTSRTCTRLPCARLFALDPDRGNDLVVTAGDLRIDYSKNRVTQTLELLLSLARDRRREQRDAMLAGARINTSEDRSVLHRPAPARHGQARRRRRGGGRAGPPGPHRDGRVHRCRPLRGVARLHRARPSPTSSTSASAAPTWGRRWCAALRDYHDGPRTHFVSNVDRPTSSPPSTVSTPRRRCSPSRRRRSPRRRPVQRTGRTQLVGRRAR